MTLTLSNWWVELKDNSFERPLIVYSDVPGLFVVFMAVEFRTLQGWLPLGVETEQVAEV